MARAGKLPPHKPAQEAPRAARMRQQHQHQQQQSRPAIVRQHLQEFIVRKKRLTRVWRLPWIAELRAARLEHPRPRTRPRSLRMLRQRRRPDVRADVIHARAFLQPPRQRLLIHLPQHPAGQQQQDRPRDQRPLEKMPVRLPQQPQRRQREDHRAHRRAQQRPAALRQRRARRHRQKDEAQHQPPRRAQPAEKHPARA